MSDYLETDVWEEGYCKEMDANSAKHTLCGFKVKIDNRHIYAVISSVSDSFSISWKLFMS